MPIPQLRMNRLCHTMTPDRATKNAHIAAPTRRLLSIGKSCRLAAVNERPGGDDVVVFGHLPIALSVSTDFVEKYMARRRRCMYVSPA